jgi:hypothetical protein
MRRRGRVASGADEIVKFDWRPPVAAAAAGAGYILGAYASLVAEVEYTYRPLAVVVILGVVVGLASAPLGRWATFGAVAVASVITQPDTVPLFALGGAGLWILGRLLKRPIDTSAPVLAVSLAFCAVGIIQVIPSLAWPEVAAERVESPVYLVMLDGYPRIDSLAEHGIDNAPFIEQLEARGFDHYPDAHSLHRWTDRTLTALLAGSPEGVPDVDSRDHERVAVHKALRVPDGWVAIAPPVGHVVMTGPTVPLSSVNDFEAFLIGKSLPAMVIPDPLREWIRADVQRRVSESLTILARTPGPVFAHLMAPHPPFPDGLECWPGCQVFQNDAARQGITVDEWWRRMGGYLSTLNDQLIAAVDAILAGHPNATIVLFSDHGGRADEGDRDEWYRTLLVARTPEHPRLFVDDPRPDAILRAVQLSTLSGR